MLESWNFQEMIFEYRRVFLQSFSPLALFLHIKIFVRFRVDSICPFGFKGSLGFRVLRVQPDLQKVELTSYQLTSSVLLKVADTFSVKWENWIKKQTISARNSPKVGLQQNYEYRGYLKCIFEWIDESFYTNFTSFSEPSLTYFELFLSVHNFAYLDLVRTDLNWNAENLWSIYTTTNDENYTLQSSKIQRVSSMIF